MELTCTSTHIIFVTACILRGSYQRYGANAFRVICKSRTKNLCCPLQFMSMMPALLVSCIIHTCLVPRLSQTSSWNLIQYTRPSFFPHAARVEHKTMFFLVAWQPCMQLFNQLNKKTVLILLHMIPNLLSLLISLAITCSIHTPHVFPSLLHTERREVSITMATISSQLHFKCT